VPWPMRYHGFLLKNGNGQKCVPLVDALLKPNVTGKSLYPITRLSISGLQARTQTMPDTPRIVVFTRCFQMPLNQVAGIFIRERMFRVAKVLPLMVVAPCRGFPFQG